VIDLVAMLHLTSACHAQNGNQITSLDGAVFPAGLKELQLVSFDDFGPCFVLCACDVQGACGVDVALLILLRHLFRAFFLWRFHASYAIISLLSGQTLCTHHSPVVARQSKSHD
jgi:hypothetical protein